MEKQKELKETLNKVAIACGKNIKTLRQKEADETPWTDEDESMFQLSGAYLTLYEENNLQDPFVQQLLHLTAHACTITIQQYEALGRKNWNDEDTGLNLMCRCYLSLYKQGIDDGTLAKKLS